MRLSKYLLLAMAGCPCSAHAHFFGTTYSLPIPFWLYAYGAGAALVVSFLLVAIFASRRASGEQATATAIYWSREASGKVSELLVALLRATALLLLLLMIAIGLFGPQESVANLGVSLFWIGFSLAFAYFSALVGGLYEIANPWQTLCMAIPANTGVMRREWQAGYWPAYAFFLLYIWIELFGHFTPYQLACSLIAYSAINLVGAWLFGRRAWFEYAECFAVYFRNISKLAPVAVSLNCHGLAMSLRPPLLALLDKPAEQLSLVIFVLFTLSSTAFDGAHETLNWVQLFWRDIFPLFEPALKALTPRPYLYAPDIYYAWQWVSLALSPFVYYAIYRAFVALTKLLARTSVSTQELSLSFALSLVPIAFAYNVTHYSGLVVTEGVRGLGLASDPLGEGWNIFGTANLIGSTYIPDVSVIWHSQVLLILVGHIAGVYLSHLESERVLGRGGRATLSQLPMLFLMIALTVLGLWILSLPIVTGQVVVPTAPSK